MNTDSNHIHHHPPSAGHPLRRAGFAHPATGDAWRGHTPARPELRPGAPRAAASPARAAASAALLPPA